MQNHGNPDDGKTWIFSIDENLIWSDGKKITTKDIDYAFSDATVDIVDDKTIKFNLSALFQLFLSFYLNQYLKRASWNRRIQSKNNIFSWWIFTKISYHKEGRKITYKFYPSDDRLKLAFKLGAINKIYKIEDPSDFNEWKTVEIEKKLVTTTLSGYF